MGAVYRAHDPQLGREVAIKVLHHGGRASAAQRARFLREAEVLARLRHPHVVALHEVGEVEGSLYLVLDLVEGETLEARLRRLGPLDLREALRITTQLAQALVQAHERGVLHRDLKPENVLLDAQQRPLLTDFGLALDLQSEEQLSQTGTFMGTPGYASPEQARGERALVGPATDVFGLGAILYACLTGRPPFEGATLLVLIAATQRATPELPSRGRRDVPAEVDALCMRCLEKDPAERFSSLLELQAALEAAPREARRRARAPLSWVLGGLALVLGLGGAWALRPQTEGSQAASPSPSEEAGARRSPAAPRVLRWALPQGARQRWTLETTSQVRVAAPPDLAAIKELFGAGRSKLTYSLAVEVEAARPAELQLLLVIGRFHLEGQAEGEAVQASASDLLPADHPLRLLLGSPIRVAFDPASGRVLRVSGVDEIARAVATATQGRGAPPQGFESNRGLETALNRLLNVLPGDEGLRAWRIPEAVDLSTQEVANYQRQLEPVGAEIVFEKLGLTKRCRATRGLPATLSWSAQDSLRDLSGEATFAEGCIQRSRVVDRADVNVRLTLRKGEVRVRIDETLELRVERVEAPAGG